MMSRRLALLINNSDYEDETLRQLVAPQADAEALAAVLRNPAIGAFDNVAILADQSADAARDAIAQFFAGKRRNDLLLLYFTGHGVLDSRGDLFLAAANTRSSRPRANSISARFIVREMDECASQRQLLILDCCNSGRVQRGMKAGARLDMGGRFEGSGFGRIILTATDEVQYAYEGRNIEGQSVHSYFTRYLVEGLREGTADANGDGEITVDEMYYFAHEQLLSRKVGHEPMRWVYGQRGKLVIARNPHPQGKGAGEVQPGSPQLQIEERLRLVQLYSQLLSDPQAASLAQQKLSELTDDADLLVARAAALALASTPQTEAEPRPVRAPGKKRKPAPPPIPKDEMAALLSGEDQRIQQAIGNLDSRLRDNPRPLQDALIAVMEDEKRPVQERASAGDALAQLGDPRSGVCTLEPDLIPINKELAFLMGENKERVTVPEPFAIAKYPVTNAQFRHFVEDGGYAKKWKGCWTPEGWNYKQKEKWAQPRYWDEAVYSLPNQPVVGISWYEAVAYANWLARKTDKPYRLPTEAEWERAVRHTDGRTYPWGETWRDGMANSEEAGIGRPSVVGIFPSGAAVCGALDMSGNVGEWCRTRWRDEKGREYPQLWADDERENLAGDRYVWRILKGGSWYDNGEELRCAFRHRYLPYNGYLDVGFRVVVSPFFSDL